MRLGMLVNDVDRVEPTQTTAMIARAALARGHSLAVFGVDDLTMHPDDRILATARTLAAEHPDLPGLCAALRAAPRASIDLDALDVVLIRTNPARPTVSQAGHDLAIALLAMHVDRGGLVLNDPVGLMRASSKLYLAALPPAYRPRTLVSRDPAAIRRFVQAEQGRCVLKPIRGTRGNDVFFVDGRQPDNLAQIIDVLVRSGVAMAQSFVPQAEQGDVRLVVMDGAPLIVDGHVAAIARRPSAGELRSNIAQGGVAEPPADLSGALAVAHAVGARLVRDGIWLAGLDLIGDQCVEINVFSTGGLRDANRFAGLDFAHAIVAGVEARHAVHQSAGSR